MTTAAEQDPAQMLNRAVLAFQAGRLGEAEQLCQKVIAISHDSFDALYLLGFVQSRLGKPNEALACYDRALRLRPDLAQVYFNRGDVLKALKRNHGALASYDRAIALQPGFARAHSRRGSVLYELRRYEEALASFDRAVSMQPGFERAHFHRANTLQALKRYDEALASFDRVLALRPGFAEAFSNRGNVLQRLKRFDEALASYDRAIALQPGFALAHYNRGNVLQDLNRFDDALTSYDRALALRPDFAEAFSNRGNVLQRLKRFDDAVASYDRAIALRPDFAEAFSNRGAALQELKRHEEALASYEGAINILPDYADAHFNKALCMLVLGDFDRGWEVHEWRWQTEQLRASRHNFTQPLWLGKTDIAGKTILLHSEQGFGDTIQFCRYVPMVAARGACVILEVQEPVRRLMNGLASATKVIARDDPLPEFDTYCPLLSLPLAFGTRLETIPAAVPYLRAASQDTAVWDARLGPRTRPRIGIAWSGLPTHKNDHNRSIRLSALLPLLDADATFVSLHKDVRADDAEVLKQKSDLLFFGNDIGDFSDTAALIANLDLVIAVDTSVAHLAGALAKPVWVLLPFMPDWRWLLDREDSPWYPTARLFRQDGTHAWDIAIARVHAALRDFIRRSS